MNKLKPALAALMAVSALHVHSQSMYLQSETKGNKRIPLSDIRNITFPSNGMRLATTKGNLDFAIADVDKIQFTAPTATGLEETVLMNENTTGCVAYPNPVEDVISILCQSCEQSFSISISSINGNVVYNQNFSAYSSNEAIEIDASKLPSGHYICSVTSDKASQKIQFVKK